MPIRTYRPTTATLRFKSVFFDPTLEKTNERLPRYLTKGIHNTSGRNHHGRITNRNIGGAEKRRYLTVSFKRNECREIPGVIEAIFYDPNRTANVALVKKQNGYKYLILAFADAKKGQPIIELDDADIKNGNCMPLSKIPVGTIVHAMEIVPGAGAQVARSAGASCQILGKEGEYILVRLPSSEVRRVDGRCLATIGVVGNGERENMVIGSAGRSRHLGRRPHVRGVAMNPVDHPLGGGEGKSSGGRHPCSPWGQLCKGVKTRNNKRTNVMIVSRRKK